MEVKQHTFNQWIKEEVTREIRKYHKRNEMKTQRIKTWMQCKYAERDV